MRFLWVGTGGRPEAIEIRKMIYGYRRKALKPRSQDASAEEHREHAIPNRSRDSERRNGERRNSCSAFEPAFAQR